MIKVPNYNVLIHLPSHCEEGELAFLTEEKKIYVYTNGCWEPQKGKGEFKMSLYELNKDIVAQLPTLSATDIEAKCRSIISEIPRSTNQEYYMLLCNEIRYYTVFVINTGHGNDLISELIECLKYIGEVKSIEMTEDKTAMEIWIVDQSKESRCMYFFNYNAGVIECQ